MIDGTRKAERASFFAYIIITPSAASLTRFTQNYTVNRCDLNYTVNTIVIGNNVLRRIVNTGYLCRPRSTHLQDYM